MPTQEHQEQQATTTESVERTEQAMEYAQRTAAKKIGEWPPCGCPIHGGRQ
ncbi:hypothetical protein [Streptomyces sp. NBC_00212]|uniref:hypothetical protein n=1 Tax=Streptomyces sp. NBC_00212 TaxID=2975684 RepID=UPI0032443DFE